MAKAATKAELITSANDNFDKMWELIDSLTGEQREQDFTYDAEAQGSEAHWKRDRNLRDVLTHLYEWHQLVLKWVSGNANGEKSSFLPPGITWANYQKMNAGFFEKHQDTPYDEAAEMLKGSHRKMMVLMEEYNEAELFNKNAFGLGLRSSIADYCRSSTASHYDWAIKKLKAYRKALKG